jgi:hypothetical protein
MTDPIRIPNVAVFEDGHGTKYRQITSYAEVTPELARQIVAAVVPEDMQRLCLELDKAKFMARLEALEKHVDQIHAWDDAHAKEHDTGDTVMCGRVEALEVGLAQLGITVVPVMVDGKPLVMQNPAPVDAGPAATDEQPPPATTEWRPCPDCGSKVLWRVGGALGDHRIQYHKCDAGPARIVGGLYDGAIQRKPVDAGPVELAADRAALGKPDAGWSEPLPEVTAGMEAVMRGATPPADDAAVEALIRVLRRSASMMTTASIANCILAAIRRGQVPGIWATRLNPEAVRNAHMEEIAALRTEVDAVIRSRDIAMCGNDLLIKERDQLKARVAELEASLDLQRKSNEQARKRYDHAHPDEAGKWPDRTDMVLWLMVEYDKMAFEHDKMASECLGAKADAEQAKAERNKNEAQWVEMQRAGDIRHLRKLTQEANEARAGFHAARSAMAVLATQRDEARAELAAARSAMAVLATQRDEARAELDANNQPERKNDQKAI